VKDRTVDFTENCFIANARKPGGTTFQLIIAMLWCVNVWLRSDLLRSTVSASAKDCSKSVQSPHC